MRIIILSILLVLLAGCYTKKKAVTQHGRSVATYPEIGADYCARIYPPTNTVIKGDSIVTVDSIFIAGEQFFDTVRVDSIVRITKTITLPAKIITQRVVITDTVRVVDNAALDLCNIEKRAATLALTTEQDRADKYKARAAKYLKILIGLGALLLLGLFLRFRKKKPA